MFGYTTAYDDTIKKILSPDIRIPRPVNKKEVTSLFFFSLSPIKFCLDFYFFICFIIRPKK